ncbi:MAG: GldG family protein [Acidobacteriia bacterium]|nr:GldG family protein [Terriglobia bacterium]
MEWKEQITGRGGKKVLAGVNFVIYTVVVIAILVLVNWFVNEHDHRWDLTPNKQYSLSPQTQKILKDLSREVSIDVFDRRSSFGKKNDVLDMYRSASRHVTVQYLDPNRDPVLAKQYGVHTYGTVVVAAGDRHFEVQGDDEQSITNALIRVLKGKRSVCFVQGHGERNLDSSDRDGFSRVKSTLESESYDTQPVLLMQKMEIPADCSLLVIAGPKNDYLPPEVDAIRKYMDGGGRGLFMLDAGVQTPNLDKLLEDWNVTPRNDLVVDPSPVAQLLGTSPAMPLILKYGSSPIVQPLSNHVTLFPLSRSFEVSKDYKAGITTDSLCETSPKSYDVMNFNPKMEDIAFRPGKDLKGPLTVAVAGTISGQGDKKKEGRFVAFGTSLLSDNEFLGFQANPDFFLNAINWLSADEDLISIRPKPPESQTLNLTARQAGKLFWLGVIGLPLLIIVAGTTVWWERRR